MNIGNLFSNCISVKFFSAKCIQPDSLYELQVYWRKSNKVFLKVVPENDLL
jgi:hypothetical protein